MPTYASTTTRALTGEEKRRIVVSVTAIHAEEAAGPRHFVQVVFNAVEAGAMFIGGEQAPQGHVWVNAHIRAGRRKAQKAAILKRIMRETGETLDVSEQSVWTYVSDIPAEGVAEFGAVLPKPGGEAAWLEQLPGDLREKLRAAA